MEFKELFGDYSNQSQAFMYPCEYAMIRLLWKDLGDNKSISQSFYEYDYPNVKPYRQSYHQHIEISQTEVLLHSYDMDWNSTCDHQVIWDGNFWIAKPCGECIVKDIKIESQFKFNQQKCFFQDAGYDKNGKLVWGKSEGIFEFTRIS